MLFRSPNIPLPIKLYTRVCPPIIFDRYGNEAAHNREYVHQCYEQVCNLMQRELEQLVREQSS